MTLLFSDNTMNFCFHIRNWCVRLSYHYLSQHEVITNSLYILRINSEYSMQHKISRKECNLNQFICLSTLVLQCLVLQSWGKGGWWNGFTLLHLQILIKKSKTFLCLFSKASNEKSSVSVTYRLSIPPCLTSFVLERKGSKGRTFYSRVVFIYLVQDCYQKHTQKER